MEVRLVSARTLLTKVGRYALSLLLSTLGVWFSVGIFDATVVTPALGRDTAKEIALRPPYPLLIMIGLLIGHISWLRWKKLCTPWVWVLPAMYLAWGIISWSHTYGVADTVHHFFGRDCWPGCQVQYQWSYPLYSSVSFSLGLILHRLKASVDDCER